MYCRNCGAKNDDQDRFCAKCGQPLSVGIANEKPVAPVKRKSGKKYMILTSLVLVVTIVVVSVFDLWPWSVRTDNETNSTQTEENGERVNIAAGGGQKETVQNTARAEEQTVAATDVVTMDNFSPDAIIEQCPDCQAAMETYIATIEACQDWTTSQETIKALENQKCAQMQHFCTAPAIYVEDIPYAYHGSFGLYTGDWIGAGPAGNGTYTGTVYGSNIVSYTGGWGFGMPDGDGELYLENYFGAWDMIYTGQMKNGMRDGTGSWFEYYDDGGYHEPTFRIYDEAVYRQDQLTDWTDCVKYNAETGEILQYCKMKTDETGLPVQGEVWNPGDLTPEQEKALGIATVVAIFGVTAYLTYSAMTAGDAYDSDAGNQRMLAEVNSWREQKAAEEQDRSAKEEATQAQIRQENRDRCYEMEAAGDTDSWRYRSCYAYSYY